LEKARQKISRAGLANVNFEKWDINEGLTLFPDDTFGGVISVHVLYTLNKPEMALREYLRVLKPGGRLILAEPQHTIGVVPAFKEIYREGGLINLVKLAITQTGVGLCNMLIRIKHRSGSYRCWSQGEMRTALEESGFSVDSVKPTYATDSLLLVTAAKPRYAFEMNGYKFASVETTEDLERALGLRYQVYCVELALRPEYEPGVEKDVYDDYAIHFLAIDNSMKPVATLRIVAANPNGFPMDEDFPLSEHIKAKGISTAVESGRFVIHKDVPREDRGGIAFGLFKCLVNYCQEAGIEDMFCTAWPRIVDKYEMPGLTKIGEEFKYTNLLGDDNWVVPLHCNIKKAYESYLKGHLASLDTD
jgi:N-acyl-L-homoserine lactone synthetase